jgi:hypothetical protein
MKNKSGRLGWRSQAYKGYFKPPKTKKQLGHSCTSSTNLRDLHNCVACKTALENAGVEDVYGYLLRSYNGPNGYERRRCESGLAFVLIKIYEVWLIWDEFEHLTPYPLEKALTILYREAFMGLRKGDPTPKWAFNVHIGLAVRKRVINKIIQLIKKETDPEPYLIERDLN